MRIRWTFVMAVAMTLLVWCLPAQARAQAVADWQMDETGGGLMLDSSGNGLHGTVGTDVLVHQATPSGWGYRFRGDWRIVTKQRLVTLADDARLDPGTSTYAVTIRFKTGAVDANLVQKGQSGQSGGFWKLAFQQGWPRCHFRDASGATRAIGFVNDVRPETKVADGEWHTLRCERTATGVKLTIDYGSATAISKSIKGTIGTIDNSRPFTLGGKYDCDGTTVTCDYFAGLVDFVSIERP